MKLDIKQKLNVFEKYTKLLPVGEHAEVAHRAIHVSALTLRVPTRRVPNMRPSCQSQLPAVTIDSLQPGHGWPPSRSSPGWTNIF